MSSATAKRPSAGAAVAWPAAGPGEEGHGEDDADDRGGGHGRDEAAEAGGEAERSGDEAAGRGRRGGMARRHAPRVGTPGPRNQARSTLLGVRELASRPGPCAGRAAPGGRPRAGHAGRAGRRAPVARLAAAGHARHVGRHGPRLAPAQQARLHDAVERAGADRPADARGGRPHGIQIGADEAAHAGGRQRVAHPARVGEGVARAGRRSPAPGSRPARAPAPAPPRPAPARRARRRRAAGGRRRRARRGRRRRRGGGREARGAFPLDRPTGAAP